MEDNSLEARVKRKNESRLEQSKCKNKCGGFKRNGSAYCQSCSDKYKS